MTEYWRFHYLISKTRHHRVQLPIKPMSSTSARGKLVYRNGRVLGLLHDPKDLVILDVTSGEEIYRIRGAGGPGCQEVLYDVSQIVLISSNQFSDVAQMSCLFSWELMATRRSSTWVFEITASYYRRDCNWQLPSYVACIGESMQALF